MTVQRSVPDSCSPASWNACPARRPSRAWQESGPELQAVVCIAVVLTTIAIYSEYSTFYSRQHKGNDCSIVCQSRLTYSNQDVVILVRFATLVSIGRHNAVAFTAQTIVAGMPQSDANFPQLASNFQLLSILAPQKPCQRTFPKKVLMTTERVATTTKSNRVPTALLSKSCAMAYALHIIQRQLLKYYSCSATPTGNISTQ